MTLRYVGTDAAGIVRDGVRDTNDPGQVIAEFWPHNWSYLAVSSNGLTVGQITRRKGRRAWWVAKWSEVKP